MSFEALLTLDPIDKQIISILQQEPELTPSEIAQQTMLNPAIVENRIMKLQRRDLLTAQTGVDIKDTNIRLARIDLVVRNVDSVWTRLNKCPYISNCFKMTGDTNLMLEIFSPSSKAVDHFVDFCLRNDPSIESITTNFIISTLHRYPAYINFDFDKFESANFGQDCWCRFPSATKKPKAKK